MPVWILIVVCINTIWCSQGATWHGDIYYTSKTDCEIDGKKRAKSYEVIVCLEGTVDKK